MSLRKWKRSFCLRKMRSDCSHIGPQTSAVQPLVQGVYADDVVVVRPAAAAMTREIRVRNFINQHFDGFLHDKPVWIYGVR